MNIDVVLKTETLSKSIRSAERFCGEPRQVLDVRRLAFAKQRMQHGIGKNLFVKHVLEVMDSSVPSRVLILGSPA